MGAIPIYDIGDKIRIGNHTGTNEDGTVRVAFTTVLGVVADPTTVTLRVRKRIPAGTAKVYGWPTPGVDGLLTREALGRFYFDLIAQTGDDGKWAWRLEGTGAVQTVDEGEYTVIPSTFF